VSEDRVALAEECLERLRGAASDEVRQSGDELLVRIPQIVNVTTRRTDIHRRLRHLRSDIPELDDTVEFLVETDAPIPIRALSPVLYVGDVPVTEVVADDDTHYRFVALLPERLMPGAAIDIGWSGRSDPQERTRSRFTFVPPPR
jgi:hypothetical protein